MWQAFVNFSIEKFQFPLFFTRPYGTIFLSTSEQKSLYTGQNFEEGGGGRRMVKKITIRPLTRELCDLVDIRKRNEEMCRVFNK